MRQVVFLSVSERKDKLWLIQTMEYHSALNKSQKTWKNLSVSCQVKEANLKRSCE